MEILPYYHCRAPARRFLAPARADPNAGPPRL